MSKLNKVLNKRGSALITALVLSVVFSITGIGTISLISRGNQLHTRDVQIVESYWANEGMRRIALRYLTRAPIPPTTIESFGVTVGGSSFSLNGVTPSVRIQDNGASNYDITVTTQVGSITQRNSANGITFDNFTRFSWFETGPERYSSGNPKTRWRGQVVYGNYHANESFMLHSDMTDEIHVTGEATSAGTFDGSHLYPGEYGLGIRVGSYSSPVAKDYNWFQRRMPRYRRVDPIPTGSLTPCSTAFDGGFNIDVAYPGYAQYYIVLDDEGSGRARIWGRTSSSSSWSFRGTQYVNDINHSSKGIIKTSKPLYIKGEIENQLTVVSDDDIYIDGDLTVDGVSKGNMPSLSDPDMLGLVSGDDIILTKKFLDDNDNRYVYGALFARDGQIRPEGYDGDYNSATWNSDGRNDVMFVGSGLVDRQGGTFSGTSKGFVMENHGDPRFMKGVAAPPGLPDIREDDHEMRDHWSVALAKSFPITRTSWSNTLQ